MPRLLWPVVNALQAIFFVVWSAGWILAALGVRLLSRDAAPALAMARRGWAPGLLWVGGVRLEIVGLENVDWSRPHYFAANHESIVDVLVLFRALAVPLLFILKEGLRRVPFLGWYTAAMGMIFLPRGNRRKSLENLRQCDRRIAEGFSILMFPEGTRSRDRRIGRFKPGVFLPAIEAGVPIVPVVLDGTGRILPRGGFRARPGTIRIVIGRPVPTHDLDRGDRRDLAEELRDRMIAVKTCRPQSPPPRSSPTSATRRDPG